MSLITFEPNKPIRSAELNHNFSKILDGSAFSNRAIDMRKIKNDDICLLYLTADQTGIADATWTPVEYDAKRKDPLGMYDTTTHEGQVFVHGIYTFMGYHHMNAAHDNLIGLELHDGTDWEGTVYQIGRNRVNTALTATNPSGGLDLELTAGQKWRIMVYINVTSGTGVLDGTTAGTVTHASVKLATPL